MASSVRESAARNRPMEGPEPQPDPGVLHDQIAERAAVAQSRYAFARRWLIKPSLAAGFLLLLLLLAGYANDTQGASEATLTLAAAAAAAGSGLGYTVRCCPA